MRFSIRPTFNPSGRVAGADFIGERLPTGGLSVRAAFEPTSSDDIAYYRAIESGVTEYASEPPEDFGPLPSGCLYVERIDAHPTHSDSNAFRIVGAFAAREFHKHINHGKAEQDSAGQPAARPVVEPEDGDKPQPEAEGRSR